MVGEHVSYWLLGPLGIPEEPFPALCQALTTVTWTTDTEADHSWKKSVKLGSRCMVAKGLCRGDR